MLENKIIKKEMDKNQYEDIALTSKQYTRLKTIINATCEFPVNWKLRKTDNILIVNLVYATWDKDVEEDAELERSPIEIPFFVLFSEDSTNLCKQFLLDESWKNYETNSLKKLQKDLPTAEKELQIKIKEFEDITPKILTIDANNSDQIADVLKINQIKVQIEELKSKKESIEAEIKKITEKLQNNSETKKKYMELCAKVQFNEYNKYFDILNDLTKIAE